MSHGARQEVSALANTMQAYDDQYSTQDQTHPQPQSNQQENHARNDTSYHDPRATHQYDSNYLMPEAQQHPAPPPPYHDASMQPYGNQNDAQQSFDMQNRQWNGQQDPQYAVRGYQQCPGFEQPYGANIPNLPYRPEQNQYQQNYPNRTPSPAAAYDKRSRQGSADPNEGMVETSKGADGESGNSDFKKKALKIGAMALMGGVMGGGMGGGMMGGGMGGGMMGGMGRGGKMGQSGEGESGGGMMRGGGGLLKGRRGRKGRS